jgi:hypothetical protein
MKEKKRKGVKRDGEGGKVRDDEGKREHGKKREGKRGK